MTIQRGFTLIEVLVSMTLFIVLMGIVTFSFMRLSSGSTATIKILELNTRADTLLRLMESEFSCIQQTTALQLKTDKDGVAFTFMIPTTNQEEYLSHLGATFSSVNPFYYQHPRFADFIWVRWESANGMIMRGTSKVSANMHPSGGANRHLRVNNTRQYLRSVDARNGIPIGMQGNGVAPTPQRRFVFFEGGGSLVHSVSMDGLISANPGEKVQVYRTVSESQYFDKTICSLFDTNESPWRMSHNYNHLYTTLELGNTDEVSGAYAVLNQDGKSVNKDRLNLLGNNAVDENGNIIYPSQMRVLYDGIEYLEINLIKKNGKLVSAIDDDDTLNDGSISIDINGVDRMSGAGSKTRPEKIHISFLMHDVTSKHLDEEDFDGDSNRGELLSSAVREKVDQGSSVLALDKIREFEKHIKRLGFTCILVDQCVRIEQ